MSEESTPAATSGTRGSRRRAATPADAAGGGRRAQGAGRRIDVLAVLLPALVGVSMLAIGDQDDVAPQAQPPTETTLQSASLVCAPAVAADDGDGDGGVLAMRVPDVTGGSVLVRSGERRLDEGSDVDLGATPVALPPAAGAVVIDGEGDAAPGLVAGRREPLLSAPCRAPGYDEWYLGLGASARSSSVITLVNPDETQAVVDITLVGPRGPIDEEDLRDVPVPGLGTVRLDLAEIAPRRVDLAAHLSVTRGRIGASVVHRNDPLGAGRVSVDTVPAQSDASTDGLLLGVEPSGESRVLYLANPGDDEVRASVRVVNSEAVFTPTGVEDVTIAPRTLRRIPLGQLVDAQAAEGMLGLSIDASAPILSTLRGLDEDDLVTVGAAEELSGAAAVVVPPGKARLYLGGAQSSGVVKVTGYDDSGEVVLEGERVRIEADQAVTLDLPEDVAGLTLESRATTVHAAVLVESGSGPAGSTVVPVRPAESSTRVPVVAPR